MKVGEWREEAEERVLTIYGLPALLPRTIIKRKGKRDYHPNAPRIRRRKPLVHGRQGYLRKCRCGICRAGNAAYMREYRARNPKPPAPPKEKPERGPIEDWQW